MKERPISLNGEMVRAVLDGRKTQHRRPLKMQPPVMCGKDGMAYVGFDDDNQQNYVTWRDTPNGCNHVLFSEYGSPGDHLLAEVAGAPLIRLEITSVRAERLRNISQSDALSEGMPQTMPIIQFAALWDSIYSKKYPVKSNPWVWVVEFSRVEK